MKRTEVEESRVSALGRGLLAFILIGAVLAIFPYTASPTGDPKVLLIQIGAALLTLLVLVWIRSSDPSGTRREPVGTAAFGALLVLMAVAASCAFSRGAALEALIQFAPLLALYWCSRRLVRMPEHAQTVLTCFTLAVAAASGYGFVQRFGYDPFPWEVGARELPEFRHMPATLGNPNLAGHVLTPALVAALYVMAARRRLRWVPVALLVAAHLYLTGHRASYVSLFAAAALALTVIACRVRRIRASRAAVIGVSVPFLVTAAGLSIAGSIQSRPDASAVLRANSFYGAARMAVSRPLLGYGPGNYEIESVRFWTPYEQERFARESRYNAHVHNEYLQLAVEAGALGPVLYLLFLGSAGYFALYTALAFEDRRIRQFALAFAAIFTVFLVDGFFGFNLRSPASGAAIAVLTGSWAGVYGQWRPPARDTVFGTRWRCAPGFVLAVIGIACAVLGGRSFAGQVYFEQGRGAMAWGAWEAAAADLSRAERLRPWDWRISTELGNVLRRMNRPEKARESFERALRSNPNYLPAIVALGDAALGGTINAQGVALQSGLEAAMQYARRALELCPNYPEAESLLGRVAMRRTRRDGAESAPGVDHEAIVEEARTRFRNALRAGAANRSELMVQLAATYQLQGEVAAATRWAERAARQDPVHDVAWGTLLALAQEIGSFERIRNALSEAVARLEKDRERNARDLARCWRWNAELEWLDGGNADAALAAYRRAVSLAPTEESIWKSFAHFADLADRYKELREAVLNRNGAASGYTPPVLRAMALAAYGDDARLQQAADLLMRGFRPGYPVRREAAQNAEYAWATRFLGSMTHPGTHDGRTLLLVGATLARTGEFTRAAPLLEGAISRLAGGEQIAAIAETAYAYLPRDPARAEAVVREGLVRHPGVLELKLALARVLSVTGRYAQARFEYGQLLAAVQGDAALAEQLRTEMSELPPP